MHSKFDQAINFFENGNLNESKKLRIKKFNIYISFFILD